jgi:cytochrome c biogenesis protein CcdA
MSSFTIALGSAFWFGLLTSVSPCPLATNIAAMSYVGARVDRSWKVLASGLLYTAGRVVAYVGLATLLVASLLSSPQVSMWLQEHMNRFLGPILILIGMVLVGLLDYGFSGAGVSESLRRRIDQWGLFGSVLLGVVFALSFCPVSAALFFGSLIPLSMQAESSILLPVAFGVGTALPVLVFALLLALGTEAVGRVFTTLSQWEWWARQATGIILIGVGTYLTFRYVFHWVS